jgi:hypothetical protein
MVEHPAMRPADGTLDHRHYIGGHGTLLTLFQVWRVTPIKERMPRTIGVIGGQA